MSAYTQAGRPMSIATPLGKDVLLLTSVKGVEALARPFHFSLEMLKEASQSVPFAELLGQPVTVTLNLAGAPIRYINGVVTRLVQGQQVHSADGGATLVRYRAEIGPRFGLLKKRVQNRIFQQKSVPQILAEVLTGLDVRFQIVGTYEPRDYCVQYRESDFAFASRLMEEEGICYFFEHGQDSHTMVVSDSATSFADLPEQNRLSYTTQAAGPGNECRIRNWEKQQDVVSGQYLARDHCFELQEHDLEYEQALAGSVAVGTVAHSLAVGPAKDLSIYEYPGRYAQRFDGMTQEGQAQSEALGKVFDDGPRTVRIRLEQEACESLKIRGDGDYCHQTPGYAFTLEKHFDGDGDYVITEVQHTASIGDCYITGEKASIVYSNHFECIPKGLTYRPPRLTPEPRIQGTQSATVVGPAGETVFCDKYGRVKVQFRWDRQGKNNVRSSCWLRVAQPWAGKGFGSIQLPRIGQEVVVAFEEGDPDRPLIIGSVYNSTNGTPFPLPEHAAQTGFKSSTIQGEAADFSGLAFDDTPGYEHVQLHSERHQTQSAEKNLFVNAGQQHHVTVGRIHTRQVGGIPGVNGYFTASGPSGSGSGGGSSSDSWSASQTGPYNWDFGVAGSWLAQDKSLTFGWQNTCVIGIGVAQTQTAIMTVVKNYLNPAYLLHGPGAAAMLALASKLPTLSGVLSTMGANFAAAEWKVNLGGSTDIKYGPVCRIHRGAAIEATGTSGVLPKMIGAFYFGLLALSEVLPAISPASRFTSIENLESMLVKVPSSILLGVWKGLELKSQQVGLLADLSESGLLVAAFSRGFPTFALSNWTHVAKVLTAAGELTVPTTAGATLASGKRGQTAESLYAIAAPQVCLLSQGTLLDTAHILLEAGSQTKDGYVSVLSSKSTMIMGGPWAMACLTTSLASGSFAVNCAGDAGSIAFKTGVAGAMNSLTMENLGTVIKSLTRIELTVGEAGQTSIKATETGITLAIGPNSITMSAGGITLKSGASRLTLNASTLTMQATNVGLDVDSNYSIKSPVVAAQ